MDAERTEESPAEPLLDLGPDILLDVGLHARLTALDCTEYSKIVMAGTWRKPPADLILSQGKDSGAPASKAAPRRS
jgi:hypothetical protein